MAHTVLVVPVPALEDHVRGRWEHYEPEWVSQDPAFTHAHITAQPSPDDLAAVARIARTTAAFSYTLADVAAFPDGIIHLVPSPSGPFTALTAALWERFPQCPPYAGEFADVVPHLTLDQSSAEVSLESVRTTLAHLLPVRTVADRLELHRYAEGDCRVLVSWRLGQ